MTHLSESPAARLEEFKWIWSVESKVWGREKRGWVRYIPTRRPDDQRRSGLGLCRGQEGDPTCLGKGLGSSEMHLLQRVLDPSGAESRVVGACWMKGNGP